MQAPPPTPAPPAQEAPRAQDIIVRVPAAGQNPNPAAVYQGLKAQREELSNQLENLEDRRQDLSQRLEEQPAPSAAERQGIEARLTETYARISALEKTIAENDAAIARAAAIPGAVQPPRPPVRNGPPEEVFVLGGMFIVIVLLPLSIALARRIWRRGVNTITTLPKELVDRLTRLEQGVDAVAVEVERIGEGQRYMARLMGEDGALRAIGAGPADPVEVKAREAEAHYRR